MNTVTIEGKTYPMRTTMGAFVAFKRSRGIDISEADNDIDAVCYFMYECVRSACRADKIDFPYSFEEFADRMDLTDLQAFQQQSGETTDGEASKKK